MATILGHRRRGSLSRLKHFLALGTLAFAAAACSTPASYQAAAIEASQRGDQKTAAELARKEVARFSTPDQCSRLKNINCGTLALAYASLAEYQILGGDRSAGESSFNGAREALGWMDVANKPGATAMVYRDVSEAYWKMGDRPRAVAVFKEGRAAGADHWLYFAAAAAAASDPPPAPPQPASPDPTSPETVNPEPANREPAATQ